MTYSPEKVKNLFDHIAAQEDQLEKRPLLRNEIPRAHGSRSRYYPSQAL